MKKGSRTLVALIYEVNKESPRDPSYVEQVVKKATATYDDPELQMNVAKYFKDSLKGWRFIREAQIKGIDWDEVFEYFKQPQEEALIENFLKEWEEYKKKIRIRDDKHNQPLINLLEEEMNEIIRVVAGVDDNDGSEKCKIFKYNFHHFQEKATSTYRDKITEAGIKPRWKSLFEYYQERIEEASKDKVVVDVKGLNFFVDLFEEGWTKEHELEIIKELGGNIVDDLDKTHIALISYPSTVTQVHKEIEKRKIFKLSYMRGIKEGTYDGPNYANQKIADRKEMMSNASFDI